jgi:glycosyltransferase involved in cell wall biosynthesis
MGIESAARALAAIDYPALEVLIVDDHSTDDTPAILQRLARELPRLRVLSAPYVPPGWTGKIHASWFAVTQGDPAARWLLFTDARVKFHPASVARAVALAEAKRLGFLSCIIRFEGVGVAEELIAIQQNRGLLTSARRFGGGPPVAPFGLGAFSMIRRDVYVRCGGHSAAPDHPLEDFMLAKSAHDCGAATSAAIASDLVALRRYQGFGDMRRRIVRTFRLAAGDSVPDLLNRSSMELLLTVLPPLVVAGVTVRAAVTGSVHAGLAATGALAFLTWLAGASTPRSAKRICGYRPWLAWYYPMGSALAIWFYLLAIGERLRGKSIWWRGRAIQPPSKAVL